MSDESAWRRLLDQHITLLEQNTRILERMEKGLRSFDKRLAQIQELLEQPPLTGLRSPSDPILCSFSYSDRPDTYQRCILEEGHAARGQTDHVLGENLASFST